MSDALYLLGFASGKVKVGKTTDLDKRLSQYRAEAEKAGDSLVAGRYWPDTKDVSGVEVKAVEALGVFDQAHGREYFAVSFMTALTTIADAGMVDLGTAIPSDVLNGCQRGGSRFEVVAGADGRPVIVAGKHVLQRGIHKGDRFVKETR